MTNGLNIAILRSVFFSGTASVISYFLLIFIVRTYAKDAVSYYLYVMTCGLLLTLVLDLAADQSLVHYSKTRKLDISKLWKNLFIYKISFLSLILFLSLLGEMLWDVDIPQLIIFMMVPAFYMGPIFEYYGLNTKYAQILFGEKLALLVLVVVLSTITTDIIIVIYAYFAISVFSLFFQFTVSRPFKDEKVQNIEFSIFHYACLYLPVYLIIISQLVYGNISRLIIDAKIGAIAFAAITLALQVVNAISIVQSQVDRHIRPAIIQAINAHDRFELRTIVKHYLLFYLAPIALGCILISRFSAEIVHVLFGSNWTEAGLALSFASPLIFTIACMRLIDILVVPLNAAKMNLLVNIVAGTLLFALLWFNSNESLESYVMLIVLCQATHVAFMSTYVYARANREMRVAGQ